MSAQLQITNLSVAYGANLAVDHVTATVTPGSITGILGPNGAGKSTLLKAALELIKPASGSVTLGGKPLSAVPEQLGYVPQQNSVDWDFPATGFDVVRMGTYGDKRFNTRGKRQEATQTAIEFTAATEFAHKPIGALSGGQKQRIFLARALAKNPQLLLLDEPFQGLDAPSEAAIMQVLRKLQQQGTTIVMVHHDLATVTDYFTEVMLLNKKLLAHGPVATTFTSENLANTYGFSAILENALR